MDSKTIVAPMTPAGVSAVAALRVSGPQVRDVVRALFGEKALEKLKAREACLGTARDPRAFLSGECADFSAAPVIDSLLYIFFEGPNSYTGEDVLELYPHEGFSSALFSSSRGFVLGRLYFCWVGRANTSH